MHYPHGTGKPKELCFRSSQSENETDTIRGPMALVAPASRAAKKETLLNLTATRVQTRQAGRLALASPVSLDQNVAFTGSRRRTWVLCCVFSSSWSSASDSRANPERRLVIGQPGRTDATMVPFEQRPPCSPMLSLASRQQNARRYPSFLLPLRNYVLGQCGIQIRNLS
jgi:hypothetical protein